MREKHIDEKLYKIFNKNLRIISNEINSLIKEIDVEIQNLNETQGKNEYVSIESYQDSRSVLQSFVAYISSATNTTAVPDSYSHLEPLTQQHIVEIIEVIDSSSNITKIGKFARMFFQEYFKYAIPDDDLLHFTDKDWCHNNFGICYPLLIKRNNNLSLSEQRKYNGDYNRYYAKEVIVNGNPYLLCSQWFKDFEPKLKAWINYRAYGDTSPKTEHSAKKTINDFECLISDNFTGKKPKAIVINGYRIDVNSQRDMWIKICKYLISRNAELFLKMIDNHIIEGRNNRAYFLEEPNKALKTEWLEDVNLYVQTLFSGEEVRGKIIKMLEYFKIPSKNCFVYYVDDKKQTKPSTKQEKSVSTACAKVVKPNRHTDIRVTDNLILFGSRADSLKLQKRTFVSILRYMCSESKKYNKFDTYSITKRLQGKTGSVKPENARRKIISELIHNDIIAISEGYKHRYYNVTNINRMTLIIDDVSLLVSQPWHNDVQQAKISAQNTHKNIVVNILDKKNKKRCPNCSNILESYRLKYHVYTDEGRQNVEFERETYAKQCSNCKKIYMTNGTYETIKRQQREYIDRIDLDFQYGNKE